MYCGHVSVAQLDRAAVFYTEGWGFDSSQRRQSLEDVVLQNRKYRRRAWAYWSHSGWVRRAGGRVGVYCFYCGSFLPQKKVTVDHATPKCRGGTHDAQNLLPACRPCNNAKGPLTLDEYRQACPKPKGLSRSRSTFFIERRLPAPR